VAFSHDLHAMMEDTTDRLTITHKNRGTTRFTKRINTGIARHLEKDTDDSLTDVDVRKLVRYKGGVATLSEASASESDDGLLKRCASLFGG
jgi:hypothetical protein